MRLWQPRLGPLLRMKALLEPLGLLLPLRLGWMLSKAHPLLSFHLPSMPDHLLHLRQVWHLPRLLRQFLYLLPLPRLHLPQLLQQRLQLAMVSLLLLLQLRPHQLQRWPPPGNRMRPPLLHLPPPWPLMPRPLLQQ